MHVRIGVLGVQRRVSLLNLELRVVVNPHTWVLGIELRSSANIGNIGHTLESAEGTMQWVRPLESDPVVGSLQI